MLHLNWRFLPLHDAVDPATAYQGVYHPALVATSLAIAILAACVALSISVRIVAARGVSYDLTGTMLSMIPGVLAVGVFELATLCMVAPASSLVGRRAFDEKADNRLRFPERDRLC
jgi:NO-binding membrane sensor protein with MHYT domain